MISEPQSVAVFSASFSTRPFIGPWPRNKIRWRGVDSECACDVDALEGTYYMTTDAFSGTVTLDSFGTWVDCSDVTYAGVSDEDPDNIGSLDFLSPDPTQWQVTLDFGTIAVLYKIAGSGGACDIASPVGDYEGDGFTATVSETP